MKKQLLLTFSIMISFNVSAADIENGEMLHGESCDNCHAARFNGDGSAIYTRENRKVRNLVKLKSQIDFCSQMTGAQWFEDEVSDVTKFLNTNYYHFK
jgi:hypothetical protein